MARQVREQARGISHARRAAVLMVLGLAATYLRLPMTLIAVPPLLWAAFESVRAIRAFAADRAPTRVVVWSAAGLVITGVLLATVLLPYAFYPAFKGYQDCMVGANTSAAKAQCRQEFMSGLASVVQGVTR